MYHYDAKTFIQIVFESVFAHYGTGYVYQNVNWELQYEFARDAKLFALTFPTIERLAKEYSISNELVKKWKLSSIEETSYAKSQHFATMHFLRQAQQEDFSFILMKGPVLSSLYPEPWLRPSSDTDVYVDLEDGYDLIHFLEKHGYVKSMDHSKKEVPVYVNLENNHRIEVHYSLWEEHSGAKFDLLDSFITEGTKHYTSITLDGIKVTTFAPTEHLLYLISHMIKHVIMEGTDLRSILDTLVFLKAYEKEIDIPALWNQLEQLGYDYFAEILFYCCKRHMHLDTHIMDTRLAPSGQAQYHFLSELANFTAMPLPARFEPVWEKLFHPYVDGTDLAHDPEAYFYKHIDRFSEIEDRMKHKFWNLHQLRLTSKEHTMPERPPVHPDLFLSQEDIAKRKTQAPYYYRAYGLTLASEIDMHELTPLEKDFPKDQIDVYIHPSPAPKALRHPKVRTFTKKQFWFHCDIATFLCRNGNEIIYEAKNEMVTDSDVKPFIISHGLVNILYMRDRISIHSATVGTKNGAITLVGDCGAGKSTYSTLLLHQGYKLIADDVSAIVLENGIPTVQLAVPQQKYKVDTALQEGYQLEDLECIDAARNKYRVLLNADEMCDEPKPMLGLFELIADTEENRLEFQKLEGMDAMRAITSNLFCQNISDSLGGLSVEAFQSVLAIAKSVPVYRIYRPTDRDARADILEFILTHCKTT